MPIAVPSVFALLREDVRERGAAVLGFRFVDGGCVIMAIRLPARPLYALPICWKMQSCYYYLIYCNQYAIHIHDDVVYWRLHR